MEIRYSPYNSPFIPSDAPPGIYWIGREYQNLPHDAHVQRYYHLVDCIFTVPHKAHVDLYRRLLKSIDHRSLTDRRVFNAGGRWFVQGIDCFGNRRVFWVSEREASELEVAVLVTPPLSLMGETQHPKSHKKQTISAGGF